MKNLSWMSRGEKIEALGQENIIPRPAALIVAATFCWVIFGFAVLLGVTGVLHEALAYLIGMFSFIGGAICSFALPDNEIEDTYFRIEEVDDSGNFKVLRRKATGDYDEAPCLVKPSGVYVVTDPNSNFKNHIMVWGSLGNLRIRLILTEEYRKEIKKAREAK